MLNKKSYFNPCDINFKISNTELTAILAYTSEVSTLLIVPFSCVISMTSH